MSNLMGKKFSFCNTFPLLVIVVMGLLFIHQGSVEAQETSKGAAVEVAPNQVAAGAKGVQTEKEQGQDGKAATTKIDESLGEKETVEEKTTISTDGQKGGTENVDQNVKKDSEERKYWIIGTFLYIAIILVALFSYMFSVHKRFFSACFHNGQEKLENPHRHLEIFSQSPSGLPIGTIRSILALMIVSITMYFFVMATFQDMEFPKELIAILGSVLGFYFGSRAVAGVQKEAGTDLSGKGQDQGVVSELKKRELERDKAIDEKERTQVELHLKKIGKNISLIKNVAKLWPPPRPDLMTNLPVQLEAGENEVKTLLQNGQVAIAAKKADETLQLFITSNPLRDLVDKADKSFGQVLGSDVSPLTIISSLIRTNVKLVGTLYQKWKARVLHLPFPSEFIPLTQFDADTRMILIKSSPLLRQGFAKELEDPKAESQKILNDVLKDFLEAGDVASLRTKYHTRFSSTSMEDLTAEVQALQRRAADLELKRTLAPELFMKAGGYDQFMSSLDLVFADREGKISLQLLVTIFEGLHQQGEPVLDIYEKILTEITPSSEK